MDPNNFNGHDVELREQDRWLPIANVARLMKNTLPTTAKVSKDAKECMQECVSEFISFITSEASDKCLREKRKTINGEDILYSMHDLGFENYAEVLKIYLAKYREQQAIRQERGETRASKRQAKQAAAAAAAAVSSADSPGDSSKSLEGVESNTYSNDPSNSETPLSRDNNEGLESDQNYVEEHLEGENQNSYLHDDNLIDNPTEDHDDIVPNNSNGTVNDSPARLFSQYEDGDVKIKEEHEEELQPHESNGTNNIQTTKVELEDYHYDDFINDEPNEELQLHNGASAHHNIEELAKQLTNDDADIDTITAGITNGSNESYF
ncbi:histone-fold-containing protein [Scheffersomyces amazonensis]|uniref:histone-fold-containing protein n=1 Tax=Scheffersomyces amazonensis TaxID=1078765 RepID=UPI00315CCCD4